MAEPTLFDEASLALIASGGAGKDGKVYSIKPVPEYGPEKVTNGNFATDSDWTKASGTTISGGKANFSNAGSVSLYQNIGTPGSVIATFSVTDYTSGSLKIYAGGYPIGTSLIEATAVGDYSVEINTTGGNGNIIFGSSDNFTGSIDNVSIKQIISSDFPFSRGSNLSATRVGPDGLIEKGRENLLKQSNNFGTTWVTNNVSVTSGQSGYDGSSDAWLLNITGGTSGQRLEQSISQSGVQTYSVYAKKGISNWIRLRVNASATAQSYFDLENGVAGSAQSGLIDRSIVSVGNGWYRCSIVFNSTSSLARIYPAEANGDVSHTSGSVYIQNSQYEIGLAATEVIESGASTGKAGLLENEPRFDYSGGVTCPSFLKEKPRTQLVPYSEYINASVSSWSSFFDTTITNNDAVSPDGTNNATRITNSGSSARLDAIVSSLAIGTYTYSFYAKGDVTSLSVNVYQESGGATLSSTPIQTLINGSEWKRVKITFTTTAVSNIRFIYGGPAASESYLIWGAQCEAGNYPTSYIPNHSGGTITRGGELANYVTVGGGSEKWSLMYEFDFNKTPLQQNEIFSTIRSLPSNNVAITFRHFTRDSVKHVISPYFNLEPAYPFGSSSASSVTDSSVLLRANGDGSYDYFASLNGVVTKASVTGMSNIAFNRIDLGPGASSAHKKVILFANTLSDTECIKLTTI